MRDGEGLLQVPCTMSADEGLFRWLSPPQRSSNEKSLSALVEEEEEAGEGEGGSGPFAQGFPTFPTSSTPPTSFSLLLLVHFFGGPTWRGGGCEITRTRGTIDELRFT
jgi:hypothetical protein